MLTWALEKVCSVNGVLRWMAEELKVLTRCYDDMNMSL